MAFVPMLLLLNKVSEPSMVAFFVSRDTNAFSTTKALEEELAAA
jgi:hypothetical protein